MSEELLSEENAAWTAWADKRPTDAKAAYRWRIPPRTICGLMLQPEWTGKLVFCGMGHAEGEWWPEGSNWDGYNRTVHPKLEWRLAHDGEVDTVWHGLGLAPDPWTGQPPKVRAKTRWIAAPVYEVESFALSHSWGTSYGWADAAKMVSAWNTRSQPAEGRGWDSDLASRLRKAADAICTSNAVVCTVWLDEITTVVDELRLIADELALPPLPTGAEP